VKQPFKAKQEQQWWFSKHHLKPTETNHTHTHTDTLVFLEPKLTHRPVLAVWSQAWHRSERPNPKTL